MIAKCLYFITALSWMLLGFDIDGVSSQDAFNEHVRPTEWLSPEEQLKTFTVPEGFKIQLFASESRNDKPGVDKPLNMAFDSRGRMWITNTLEYPIAVPTGEAGRDSIKILEDTTGDGQADKITAFADGLNIPIGILPIENGCIAFSIPNIWKLEDTTGDGKCDKRTVLYGPFGVDRDTHGLNNAFTRGLDGWIYACHGFNNHTTVKGKDGNVVTMQSGNTYRFREDGSRIEHFTHGQVNPFGMVIDERGNFFTSDCHSKPIYQLLQGGYYPSFGKPHDGLGFVPEMTEHTHDSTALDGVCYLDDDRFPPEFRKNFLVGNVMTSRVNRDSVEFHGSTMQAIEKPDLVTTTDPWFRPVDIQLGPDGAIYIADFYNKIIGHYEVDLNHVGRDRTSGRIWRLVWKGDSRTNGKAAELAGGHVDQLLSLLRSGNISQRMLAFHELTNLLTIEGHSRELLDKIKTTVANSAHDQQRALCVWLLEHAKELNNEQLTQAFLSEGNLTRLYAAQVLSERAVLEVDERKLLYKMLVDVDPFVRRKAIQAIGLHPEASEVVRFCTAIQDVSDDDLMLQHAARISLRNILKKEGAYKTLNRSTSNQRVLDAVGEVSLAVKSAPAAEFLLDQIRVKATDGSSASLKQLKEQLKHIAQFLPLSRTEDLVLLVRERFSNDPELQADLLFSISDGAKLSRQNNNVKLRPWALEVASLLLEKSQIKQPGWRHEPIRGSGYADNPWFYQQRGYSVGEEKVWLLSTFPPGEKSTGKLLSVDFDIPQTLSFFIAGHDGLPNKKALNKNFVRLIDAKSGEVLREATVPRNDVAQKTEWKFADAVSRRGRIEIVDGNSSASYAWIAVGRFSPNVVPMPKVAPDITTRQTTRTSEIVQLFDLKEMQEQLEELLASRTLDWNSANAIAATLATLRGDFRLQSLAKLAADMSTSEYARELAFGLISDRHAEGELLADGFRECISGLTMQQQLSVAQNLAKNLRGAEYAVELVRQGLFSAELLRNESLFTSLLASVEPDTRKQAESLRDGLPDVDEKKMAEIQSLVQKLRTARTDAKQGGELFTKHCAACHQIDGVGKVIGPQLDGIGGRGVERIVEDVFLPNRNVDVAFRMSVINDIDGRVLTGLFRREEAGRLFFADIKGEEFFVQVDDVDDRYETPLSLMPENWLDTLKEQESLDLLKFLTQQKKATSADN